MFLIGFRIALNVTDGNVIDVGYAGVIGADRITGPGALYGGFPLDNEHGDTYGPVAYAAYVPFEAAVPVERQRGTTCPPPTLPRWPSTWAARCCCGCSAGGCAGRSWACCSPTCG